MLGWIEITAVVFGFICVALTVRQNIWCWPTGLVQVLLFIYIFYEVKLYSDLILHVIYVFLQIYGWYFWLHGGEERSKVFVTTETRAWKCFWFGVTISGTLIWGLLMYSFTDASLPFGDAFTTVASLVGQWLMSRKRLESWLLWIAVDVIAIWIYWYKELYWTSALYVAFLILAIIGWFSWKRSYSLSKEVANREDESSNDKAAITASS